MTEVTGTKTADEIEIGRLSLEAVLTATPEQIEAFIDDDPVKALKILAKWVILRERQRRN